jgi:hypothetical protein
MKRRSVVGVLGLLMVAPLLAQAPKGWMVRVDRSTSASDPDAAGGIQFMTMGSGFHAVNPQAAVFWNPANTATGSYSLKGSFTLMRPSNHVNYYGLIVGGSDLGGPAQGYLYFMVAQDGTWLIKRRDGNATQNVARGSSGAIKQPDSSGKSVNALEVRVTADKIDYLVNGTSVQTVQKTGAAAKTDGIYGFRINHMLEVFVDGLTVTKS